ncbi:sensor histidine kinase [Paenibacillus piri]|uniref:histidine kinase n=1 Tax=Paenibacillus piri TaxID=2547395 RepID=A0A4R5KSA9_9BACL|nr:sensor histidine kinase [Paenibacillus piri]TDF98661.1 sensor histidine kinase [Paenibacillus piri]
MLSFFINLKIQNKIFVTFAPLFFLVILSIAYFFYSYAEQNILKKAGDANLNVLFQIADKIEIINGNVKSISTMYFLDPNIRLLLKNDWTDRRYEELVTQNQMKTLIDTVNNNFQYLNHMMTLLGFNENYYNNEGTDRRDQDKLRSAAWIKLFEEDKSKMIWADTYRLNGKYIFSVISYMRNVYTGKDLGLLVLDFDENILFDTYKNLEDNHIQIYNSQGILISGPDKSRLTTSAVNTEFFKKISGNRSGYFLSGYEGKETLISFHKVQQLDWYIVDMTPLSSLLEGMQSIKKYIVLIAMAELIILFVLSYMISYAISSPIKKLVQSINLASSGNLNHMIDVNRKDEIGFLVAKYNTMLERIDSLMKEIVIQHEKKRRAEMQGLQAQMNPHFLYNTLNSIRWMVRTNQPDLTNDMIISLVRLLRQNFNAGNELITFSDELKFLSDYILIQKVRYGDKFDVVCDFDEKILPCYTLRLLFQPILENAIFHGIEPKDGNGIIHVKIYPDGDRIIVEIFDDGVGIDLNEQPSPLSEGYPSYREESNGIGLRNIQQRIKLHFGDNYGVWLHSAKDWGTRVTIVLPVIRERDVTQ